MHRITITLDGELLQVLDRHMDSRGHENRSEAIRDLIRSGLEAQTGTADQSQTECVGALVYVYDRAVRHLPDRLTNAQHDQHDLSVATLHVHLDHESCLEVAVLRGDRQEVTSFADAVSGERGVRYGRLVTVPIETDHASGKGAGKHRHTHRPKRPRK